MPSNANTAPTETSLTDTGLAPTGAGKVLLLACGALARARPAARGEATAVAGRQSLKPLEDERVAHAVRRLQDDPSVLCVGSSKMFTYFPDRKEVWSFGPYRENHATAATIAFRRSLLTRTRYKEDDRIIYFLPFFFVVFLLFCAARDDIVLWRCAPTCRTLTPAASSQTARRVCLV